MIKRLISAIFFSLVAVPAFAACTPGFILTPGSGSNQTFSTKAAGDTNCESLVDVDTASQLHQDLTASIPAGTNNIGFVTPTPSATGGWSKWSTPKNNSNTPLSTTVTQVKGSAGTFGGYYISNPNTSTACLQVFDAATAGAVTLGTTRPDLVFCVPAASSSPGAANLEIVNGVNFASGIQIAWTTTASGSTAPSTGADLSIFFK